MPFIAVECSPDERPSFSDEAHGSEDRRRTRAALDQVTPATGEQTSSASGGFPCSLSASANTLRKPARAGIRARACEPVNDATSKPVNDATSKRSYQ
jgi:hypothetical protein